MASWADGSAADLRDFLNRACQFAFGEVYRYSPAVRVVRDAVNTKKFYDEEDFSFRFCFTKASVIAIMSELQLKKNTDRRGTPLPPLLKVLITLRFYGTGAMQTVVGYLVRVSQQYASRCVWEITQVICFRLFPNYVRLPDVVDANAVMARFYAIGLFPGVTGCIEGTHNPIVSPGGENAEVFRNHKGYFSLNVQAITGAELQFFDIVASWPRSVHDSRIFTNSRVMALYEQKAVPGVFLGDQGYACLPFLMTPLKNPQTSAEKRHNKSQIKTKNSVELTFGVWKRRFACLRVKLLTDTDRSAAIITACAALYNIACLRRDPCALSDEAHPDVNLPDNPSQGDPDTFAGAQGRSCYIRWCFSPGNEHTASRRSSSSTSSVCCNRDSLPPRTFRTLDPAVGASFCAPGLAASSWLMSASTLGSSKHKLSSPTTDAV